MKYNLFIVVSLALVLTACTRTGQSPLPVTNSSDTGAASTLPTGQATVPQLQAVQGTTITFINGFAPGILKVKVGQTVTFMNNGDETVQVQSDPHPTHNLYPMLNLGTIPVDKTKTVTLTKAGTYTYHNHVNPSETGTIIVE